MKYVYVHVHKRQFLALGLALLLMLLAACGTNGMGTTTGSSGSAPTATTNATQTTAAQNCGAIHTMRLLLVPADQNRAQGVENCFWQAYQQCHAATLSYIQSSVDTAAIHTFTLKNQNNQCVITDALQHQTMPRAPQSAGSYTCTGLTRKIDGLHFSACGSDGDLVVPSGGVE